MGAGTLFPGLQGSGWQPRERERESQPRGKSKKRGHDRVTGNREDMMVDVPNGMKCSHSVVLDSIDGVELSGDW